MRKGAPGGGKPQHSKFLERNGVCYSKRNTSFGTLATLERIEDGDSNDNNDNIPSTRLWTILSQ